MKASNVKKLQRLLASLTPGRKLDPNVYFVLVLEIAYLIDDEKPGLNIPLFIGTIDEMRRKRGNPRQSTVLSKIKPALQEHDSGPEEGEKDAKENQR